LAFNSNNKISLICINKERMMRPLALMIGLIGVVSLPYQCSAQIWDDPFSQYVERSITIAPGAGNAKDANAAIHTIDPWPPYVGHTRIPTSGRRAVGAVEQMYRKPSPFFTPWFGGSGGAAAGGGGGSGSNTSTGMGGGTSQTGGAGGYE
jgi:hypothetical protein